MHRRVRTAVLAALTIGLTAGCAETGPAPRVGSSASASAGAVTSVGSPWYDELEPATAAGIVGPAGSDCELPISFDMPTKWKAKQVDLPDELMEIARKGGATLRCEVDAKPAGHLGYLGVWTVDDRTVTVRQGLETFLAGYENPAEIEYRDATAGPAVAVEATFLRESALSGDRVRARALGVQTPAGTVLFTLNGIDDDEHEQMLPGYLLARQTVALTG